MLMQSKKRKNQNHPKMLNPRQAAAALQAASPRRRARRLVSLSLNNAKVKAILMTIIMIMMAWNICVLTTREDS